jgi:hypothetical protein
MRLATTAVSPLPMAGERIRIHEFLQARPDYAIRVARGQYNNGDSATPQGSCFDRRPTPSPTLIQITEQLDIFAADGFYGFGIVHPPVMVLQSEGPSPIPVT